MVPLSFFSGSAAWGPAVQCVRTVLQNALCGARRVQAVEQGHDLVHPAQPHVEENCHFPAHVKALVLAYLENPFCLIFNPYICSFNVIEATTPSLENMEIICFAESHDQREQIARISQMVAHLYCHGQDVILLEGYEGPLTGRVKQHYLRKYSSFFQEMELEGWDSLSALQDENFKRIENELATLQESPPSRDVMTRITFLMQQKALFVMGDQMVDRNRSMALTIEKHRTRNRRVFVIAGAEHFHGNFMLRTMRQVGITTPCLPSTLQEAHRVVKTVLAHSRYAILQPI